MRHHRILRGNIVKYAVIENDEVVNIILWDGKTAYDPGRGRTLVPMSDLPSGADFGWRRGSQGVWAPPAAGFQPRRAIHP